MIWDMIVWCWIAGAAICVVALVWQFVDRNRALNKALATRRDILQRIRNWECRTGRKKLALKEYDQVTLQDLAKAIRRKTKIAKLYGPIIQTLARGDASKLADKQWWRCYKEIYLDMDSIRQEQCRGAFYKVQLYAQSSDFFIALQLMNVDGHKILKENDQRIGKTLMSDGAAEYDDAMAAQELMQ